MIDPKSPPLSGLPEFAIRPSAGPCRFDALPRTGPFLTLDDVLMFRPFVGLPLDTAGRSLNLPDDAIVHPCEIVPLFEAVAPDARPLPHNPDFAALSARKEREKAREIREALEAYRKTAAGFDPLVPGQAGALDQRRRDLSRRLREQHAVVLVGPGTALAPEGADGLGFVRILSAVPPVPVKTLPRTVLAEAHAAPMDLRPAHGYTSIADVLADLESPHAIAGMGRAGDRNLQAAFDEIVRNLRTGNGETPTPEDLSILREAEESFNRLPLVGETLRPALAYQIAARLRIVLRMPAPPAPGFSGDLPAEGSPREVPAITLPEAIPGSCLLTLDPDAHAKAVALLQDLFAPGGISTPARRVNAAIEFEDFALALMQIKGAPADLARAVALVGQSVDAFEAHGNLDAAALYEAGRRLREALDLAGVPDLPVEGAIEGIG